MRHGTLFLIALTLASGAKETRAGFLTIQNAGFESPGYEYVVPTGWTADQANANFLDYENHLNGQLLAPPGTDVGNWSAFVGGAGSGSQVIANSMLAANSTYTLSALVGGRLDSVIGFGGSTIELFDATTSSILASYTLHRGANSPVNGYFQAQSASFSTGQAGGPIGDLLGIRLIGLGEVEGNFSGTQTWFDNVSVQVSPSTSVPEPTSSVLLGMGAVTVLGYLGRKARMSTTRA